jgi:hypothetical protein
MRSLRFVARAMIAAAMLGAAFVLPIAAHASAPNGGLLDPILPTPSASSGVLDPLLDLLPSTSPLPLPSLPGVDDIVDPVTSLVEPLPGQLNDTITDITDLLLPQDQPQPGGSTGTGGGNTSTGGSKGSKGSTGTKSGSGGTTAIGGIGPFTTTITGAAFSSPYGATAGRAAAHAAGRALRLLGPLAPALLLAALAFGVLIALTRGSQRLVKLDQISVAKRTWRL